MKHRVSYFLTHGAVW